MITAVFTDNSDYARVTGLWQWDYGQKLRIEGLRLPTAVEIHFALAELSGDAITRVGTTKDSVTEVVIPDSLLENQMAFGATYEIYAWIYLADKETGETIKRISMQVKCRPKPEAFDTPGDAELFREAIEAVNASADRAETAREGAEAAQKAAEAAANKIEGEISGAEELAKRVKKDAEAVSQMATETTQNAQKATKAAQAAENSSNAAKKAQEAAENAGERATSAMEEVEKDRTEVAENRKAVEQAKEAVAADRRAVEQITEQFGEIAGGALEAVGQAQEAAVRAVVSEGQEQTTAVQDVGTQAVQSVETAKTAVLQAVTTEGDKQVGRVQDAAAGIVADREQISENKAEIASLRQNKADAIVETVAGESMTLTDSSDKLFRGLRVFGKSTQDGTPSVEMEVPIVNAGESGSIKVDVTGRNLFPLTEDNIIKNVALTAVINLDGAISISGTPSRKYESVFSTQLMDFRSGTYYLGGGVFEKGKMIVQLNIVRNDDTIEYVSNKSFELKEGDKKRVLSIQYSNDELISVNQIIYPILVHGTEGVPFEPYIASQFLTLATPNGLPGVPVDKDGNYVDSNGQQWITDEIDLGRGKYVQRVKKMRPLIPIVFVKQSENGRCESFDLKMFNVKWASGRYTSISTIAPWSEYGNGKDKTFALHGGGIYYKDSNKKLEEVNAMFAQIGTDFEVCGVLEPPIERDLTPEELAAYEALHTNYPTTVITNDAGAHMEVSYVADTKAYINKKFEELNQAIVKTQIALL